MVGMVMVGADDPKPDGMHSYDATGTCTCNVHPCSFCTTTTTFLFFK